MIDSVARAVPTRKIVDRRLAFGELLAVGNTAEKARKVAGIMQALAKVRRPQNSV